MPRTFDGIEGNFFTEDEHKAGIDSAAAAARRSETDKVKTERDRASALEMELKTTKEQHTKTTEALTQAEKYAKKYQTLKILKKEGLTGEQAEKVLKYAVKKGDFSDKDKTKESIEKIKTKHPDIFKTVETPAVKLPIEPKITLPKKMGNLPDSQTQGVKKYSEAEILALNPHEIQELYKKDKDSFLASLTID
jgi:hypothetical protein